MLSPLTYIHVGKIDIETCRPCGGAVKVIASIEDAAVIKQLDHLEQRAQSLASHPARAPPQGTLSGPSE